MLKAMIPGARTEDLETMLRWVKKIGIIENWEIDLQKKKKGMKGHKAERNQMLKNEKINELRCIFDVFDDEKKGYLTKEQFYKIFEEGFEARYVIDLSLIHI